MSGHGMPCPYESAHIAEIAMTYDEIAAYPDEARRELHDGAPVVLYAPGRSRSLVCSQVLGRLAMWLFEAGKSGQIYHGVDWQLDDSNSLVLDLCYFKGKRAKSEIERANNQCLVAAPDLVIQILDSTVDSAVAKRQKLNCETRGVSFFWRIDVEARTFEALEANGNVAALIDGASLESPLFPGFKLFYSQVFDEDLP